MGKRAAGEGSLTYDDKRNLWVGRLPRSVDPKRRAVYGRSQAKTRDKLRRAMRAAEQGVTFDERTKLGDYLDHWVGLVASRVQAGKLAPATAAGYERAVRLHIVPALGRVPVAKLTPGKVEEFLGSLQAQGLRPATVRHVRATLSRALSDAVRDELVVRNVARLVEPPPLARRNPSAFTPDEFGRIKEAAKGQRLGALFVFAAYTGLRRSEALGLRWRDVDLDDGTFQVARGVHQFSAAAERVVGRTGLVESRPKTDASGDRLPLSEPAVALLAGHHRDQAAERLRSAAPWPNAPADTHVFASTVGTPLHPSNVSRAWRRLLEVAEVPHVTPDGRPRGMHELRRTFATRLRDRGIPLEDVQRLGRWASSKMLLEVYAASGDDRLRNAANAVGEAMSD